jgi:thioredoxin 1
MKTNNFSLSVFLLFFVLQMFIGCQKQETSSIPEGGQVSRYTQLTDADYEEFLAKQPGLVLVDFDADWCGWCRKMDSGMAKLNSELVSQVKIVKIDFDKNPVARKKFNVQGIPALFLYKDGELKDAGLGYLPEDELFAFVKKHLDEKNPPQIEQKNK